MEKCLLIVNPISGTTDKQGLAERTIHKLRRADIKVEVLYTERPGDAREYAGIAAQKGYLGAIAAGGDGTVNEVASGLIGSNTALGILPLGSGNGLARHLNISTDIFDALNVISKRNIVDCDYCDANGHPFFCTFGLGFDAAVSKSFSKSKHRGLATYIRSALQEYLKFEPSEYLLEANGKRIRFRAFIVAACNASQYGNNAFIAPEASIKDGLMDLTIVHAGTPFTQAIMGVDLLTGMIRNNMIIQTMKVKEATIRRLEEGPVHLDGDPMDMGEEIKLFCHHHQLKIFTTGEPHPVHPFLTPLKYFNREILNRLRRLRKDY